MIEMGHQCVLGERYFAAARVQAQSLRLAPCPLPLFSVSAFQLLLPSTLNAPARIFSKSSPRRNPLEVFEAHAGCVENNVSMKEDFGIALRRRQHPRIVKRQVLPA